MSTPAAPGHSAVWLTIEEFWNTFPPLWNYIREHLRDVVLVDVDLTVQQFHVLGHIRQGMTSVSDLAAVRRISRPAISQAVDGLVQKGLVRRGQSANDRRYVPLELTPGGNAVLDTIFHRNRTWMAARLARLTPGELANLQHGLAALQKAFAGSDELDPARDR
jgi:DNA-binding MarR family transcriptional regulator